MGVVVSAVVATVVPVVLTWLGVSAAESARRAEEEEARRQEAERIAKEKKKEADDLATVKEKAEADKERAKEKREEAENILKAAAAERKRVQDEEAEATRKREKEDREKEDEEKEKVRKKEAARVEAEAKKSVEDAIKREEEANKRKEEAIRREAAAKKREEEAKKREKEAKEREEEAKRQEKEAERLAEEAKRQEEEARREAEELIRKAREAQEQAEEARRHAEEAKRKAEEQWMRGIPPEFQPTEGIKQQFRQRYNIQDTKINIGIVGESGTGKSSLLNALRGLSPRDPGAARCGFNETTAFVQGYPDPRNPNIVWYDVPGANTPSVKGWTYFSSQGLFVFTIMVVVFADRFTETVGTLITNANKCSIPAFLVRTKADLFVRDAQYDWEDDEPLSDQDARQIVVRETRKMVSDNLARLELPEQMVYIVSKIAMKELVTKGDKRAVMDEQRVLDDILLLGPNITAEPNLDGRGSC